MRPIEVAVRCVKLLAVFCVVALTFSVHAAAPEISSPLAVTAPINVAFSYTITATNGPNTFGAVGLPGTLTLNTTTGVISGTPTATANLSITISANNGSGTDTQTLTLNIYDPNLGGTAPLISSDTAFSMVVNTAATVYQVTATNTPTSFGATNLPTGLSINTSNGVISAAASTAVVGQYTINVTATNSTGTGSMPVVVVINPSAGAPVISNAEYDGLGNGSPPIPPITHSSGTPISYAATGLPAGITLDTTTGNFLGSNAGMVWALATYFATDSSGRTGVKTVILQIFPGSNPPSVTSGGPPAGTVGQPYSYQMTASVPGTSFNCVGLLNGLTMNSGTGLISGIPTAAGQFSVTLTAGLIGGRSSVANGTKSATIIINPAPPTITSATIVSGTVGTALSYQIIAAGATSFGATNLPPGLSINATGLISGTPTTQGGFTVNVTASKAGLTGNQNVAFNIGGNGANPIITSALTATGAKGSPFTYQITATGAPPITFTATGLPPGLTFATDTISGTPTGTGSYSVTLTATNFAGTSTQFLLIAIPGGAGDTPAAFLSPASASPNPGTTGSAITFTGAASDTDGDAVSYSWDFGDGLFGAGASTTHTYTAAGLYTVKLTISDGTQSVSQTFDVGVNDASPSTLTIKKASIKFNFSKSNQDSLSLSGTVSLPSGFVPLNKKVSVGLGGVRKDLVLGKTGRAGDANNSFSLQFKKSPATFTFNVKKQALFASLEGLGFTNATVAKPGKSITCQVVVEIDGVSGVADVKFTYTATAKKAGTAK